MLSFSVLPGKTTCLFLPWLQVSNSTSSNLVSTMGVGGQIYFVVQAVIVENESIGVVLALALVECRVQEASIYPYVYSRVKSTAEF